jgi:hypothetical protein
MSLRGATGSELRIPQPLTTLYPHPTYSKQLFEQDLMNSNLFSLNLMFTFLPSFGLKYFFFVFQICFLFILLSHKADNKMVSAEAVHDNEETDKLLSENCFQRIPEDNNSSDDAHQDKHHHDQDEVRVGDEDLLHVDPFTHKIEMPTWMW